MVYLGRDGYTATREEVESLPDYHAAFNQYGYKIPAGSYKTISASTHLPAIIDVSPDPQGGIRECYSPVQIVAPVRDAICTPLDDEFQFSKY